MSRGIRRRWAIGAAALFLLALVALLLVRALSPLPPPARTATDGTSGSTAVAERTKHVEEHPPAPARVRGHRAEAAPRARPSTSVEGRRLVVTVRDGRREWYRRPVVTAAEVGLLDSDDPRLPLGTLPLRTDSDGRAVLFPEAESVRVYARRGTDAVVSGIVRVPHGEERRVGLVLRPAVAIRGHVVDDDGAPLPRARLRARVPAAPSTKPFSEASGRGPPPRAVIVVPLDESGRFEMPPIPAPRAESAVMLQANLAGHVPATYAIPEDCGATHEVEIRMLRAVRVRGRVIAAGRPAAAFEAISVRPGSRIAMPGPHPGEFVFPPLPARGGTFVVRSEGFAPKAVSWPSTSAPEMDMGDIHLDAGHTLEGLVLWPDGTPAGGAKVQTRSDHVEGLRVIGGSAPDGSFSFPHLAAVEHRIEAERGGGNAWISSRERASRTDTILPRFGRVVVGPVVPGGGPVRVVLETGRVVILRFVDSRTGEVTKVHSPRFTARTRGASRSAAGSHYLGIACAVAFHLNVPGPWRIEITSDTHEPVALDLVNVADTERRDVTLTPKSDGAE